MDTIKTLLLVLVIFCVGVILEQLCSGDEAPRVASGEERTTIKGAFKALERFFFRLFNIEAGKATMWLIIAAIVGVINYTLKRGLLKGEVAWISGVFTIVMIALYLLLIYKWSEEGSRFRELLAFAVMAWLWFYTTKAAAALFASVLVNHHSKLLAAVVFKAPVVVLIITLTYFVVDMLKKGIEDHRMMEILEEGGGIDD